MEMYLLLCRSTVTGRALTCAVLHPLHQGIDFYPSLPVSASHYPNECQDFFPKSGELGSLLPCASMARQSEWVLLPLGYCGRATTFTGLILNGGGCTCNMHGSSFIRCVSEALTGPERGGELPVLGLCRARERRGAACIRVVQGQGVPCRCDAVLCTHLGSWHFQGTGMLEWNLLSWSCLQV